MIESGRRNFKELCRGAELSPAKRYLYTARPAERSGGATVMARQGSVLVATFHPELTDDPAVHRYFCEMVRKAASRAA
jgi:glutamine amidotransferase PdxT